MITSLQLVPLEPKDSSHDISPLLVGQFDPIIFHQSQESKVDMRCQTWYDLSDQSQMVMCSFYSFAAFAKPLQDFLMTYSHALRRCYLLHTVLQHPVAFLCVVQRVDRWLRDMSWLPLSAFWTWGWNGRRSRCLNTKTNSPQHQTDRSLIYNFFNKMIKFCLFFLSSPLSCLHVASLF